MKRLFCFTLSVIIILFAFSAYSANEQQAAAPVFDIKGFNVEGNTRLSQKAVDRRLAKFTGPKKNFGTIQKAVEALETMYRRRGYNTVRVTVPEQELENGIVRLIVLEARITAVKVEGNRHFDEKNIRRSLPSLREAELPDMDKISNSLRVANEHPAKKINMQLQAGENESEIEADLKVFDEKAWKVSFTADNTGNDATGESRTGVFLQYNNLFNRDHLVTLQYITSPENVDKVTVLGMGYRIPLYTLGDSIDLYATYSDIDS